MTVLECIQRSTEFLGRKGVDSPRLQAELMLAEVLQMPRLKLYLNFERPLLEPETDQLREMVKRRGQREPLQHILGSVSFCGVELAVNADVLVPRPETELLAEKGWVYLAQAVADGISAPQVLDFGTGSGCLAVVLALKCPQARIWAVDVSEKAIRVAQQNAEKQQVGRRIEFLPEDGLKNRPTIDLRFHLIISNPPYIPSGDIPGLQPEVRDFDPHLALDGGPDGLAIIRQLASEAPACLAPAGRLMLEFGDGQEEQVQSIFTKEGWAVQSIVSDYSKRPRILIAHRGNS